jgi:hypothetical protein
LRRLNRYFDVVRDVEQRTVKSESTNRTFEVADQPAGVPQLSGSAPG